MSTAENYLDRSGGELIPREIDPPRTFAEFLRTFENRHCGAMIELTELYAQDERDRAKEKNPDTWKAIGYVGSFTVAEFKDATISMTYGFCGSKKRAARVFYDLNAGLQGGGVQVLAAARSADGRGIAIFSKCQAEEVVALCLDRLMKLNARWDDWRIPHEAEPTGGAAA
jgi:hypothetical protein